MRFVSLVIIGVCMWAGRADAQDGAAAKDKAATDVGSYGIGMNVGRGMKDDGLELNLDLFVQGMRDALEGKEAKYTDDQIRDAFQSIQQVAKAKKEARGREVGDKNKKEGETFLAANKSKEGVKTVKSGLQYQVLKSGTGPSPAAADTVRVHYEGTLLDGTVFDSSIRRNEPAEFPVGGVIPGWTEALQLMKVGDRWRIFLPSELAYGAQGAGGKIGPHAVLTFEVELLEVKPAAK